MKDYVKKLHWKTSNEEFNKICEQIMLDKDIDYSIFILPKEGKDYWENCARVLERLNDNQLISLFPKILEWFKDINWPGGRIILNRINRMPSDMIEDFVLQSIDKAVIENDSAWIEFLLCLDNIKTKKISLKIQDIVESNNKMNLQELIEWLNKLPIELQENK